MISKCKALNIKTLKPKVSDKMSKSLLDNGVRKVFNFTNCSLNVFLPHTKCILLFNVDVWDKTKYFCQIR